MRGILVTLLLLMGCAQVDAFVAKLPRQVLEKVQHDITAPARELAVRTSCDEQPGTLEAIEEKIERKGLLVQFVKVTKGRAMSPPGVLVLPKEDRPSTCEDGERDEEGRCRFVPWDDLPERDRVRHRQHELRHFCMRAQVPCHDQLWLWGHCDSPKSFPRSDYRAALETAAYLGEVPSEFVRDYALHDLDPDSLAQMVEEARSARSN